MATKEEIEAIIRSHKPELQRRYKVKEIGFFGSQARGEAGDDSDIDVLVELSEPIGWELVDLQEYLEDILGMKVDLVTTKAIKPQLSASILGEVIYA
jgi:predicted nucleotidyltransferase